MIFGVAFLLLVIPFVTTNNKISSGYKAGFIGVLLVIMVLVWLLKFLLG